MPRRRRPGEFELIARYFAPLAKSFGGARGLKSDNAFLPADARHDLVVKTDTVVEGVHFPAGEKSGFVAQRALARCLSDLAAGGAKPFAYQISLALPRDWDEPWVRGFAGQLAVMQRTYGIVLCGGDTTSTPGPTTVAVTAFGKVPRGKGLGRDGARAGHELWVSGTIGDAALGLLVVRGELKSPELENRYRMPRVRTSILGPRLIGIASATADVSDGLLADAGHIAEASNLAIEIERDCVPLSRAAKQAVAANPRRWTNVLSGGDDYELLIALPPARRAALLAAAKATNVPLTRIGRFKRGGGVRLTVAGRPTPVQRAGYVHF
jgi:thiamine-monophosphate kinase